MKFTQSNVRTLRAPAGKADHTEWDDAIAGFGIRFRNGGEGVYTIKYFINGEQAKLVLGKVSQVTLEAAQIEARQAFALIAKKIDPRIERAKVVAKSDGKMAPRVDDFAQHLAHEKRSEEYINRTKKYLNDYFKPLHKIPLREIDRQMVGRELKRITAERGRIASTRARAALSHFFNWAIRESHADTNPTENTTKYKSEARDRALEPDEVVTIWRNAGDGDYADIIRLLILTGARRDMIGGLRRSEIKEGYLDLPAQRNKNGKRFLVPLSPQARAILTKRTAREGSEFVFGEGEAGFSGWSKCKERIDQRIADAGISMDDWVLHDFRRTLMSLGQKECKILPYILDVCLSHIGEVRKGVKGAYNHYDYLAEKTDAMNRWGEYVDGLLRPKFDLIQGGAA